MCAVLCCAVLSVLCRALQLLSRRIDDVLVQNRCSFIVRFCAAFSTHLQLYHANTRGGQYVRLLSRCDPGYQWQAETTPVTARLSVLPESCGLTWSCGKGLGYLQQLRKCSAQPQDSGSNRRKVAQTAAVFVNASSSSSTSQLQQGQRQACFASMVPAFLVQQLEVPSTNCVLRLSC